MKYALVATFRNALGGVRVAIIDNDTGISEQTNTDLAKQLASMVFDEEPNTAQITRIQPNSIIELSARQIGCAMVPPAVRTDLSLSISRILAGSIDLLTRDDIVTLCDLLASIAHKGISSPVLMDKGSRAFIELDMVHDLSDDPQNILWRFIDLQNAGDPAIV